MSRDTTHLEPSVCVSDDDGDGGGEGADVAGWVAGSGVFLGGRLR